jgi:hypothetical protein
MSSSLRLIIKYQNTMIIGLNGNNIWLTEVHKEEVKLEKSDESIMIIGKTGNQIWMKGGQIHREGDPRLKSLMEIRNGSKKENIIGSVVPQLSLVMELSCGIKKDDYIG